MFEEPQRPENIGEMSRKNRERVEEREEVEEGVQPPLVTAMSVGGGNDMVLMMQMWMEESKRIDETWRTEVRLQREEAREREEKAKNREERLLDKMQAQIEVTTQPVTIKTRTESLNLPRLTAEGSLDTFISTFEDQLNMATVPETDWKLKLVGQLDECHRIRISDLISDLDSSYAASARVKKGKWGNQFLCFPEILLS